MRAFQSGSVGSAGADGGGSSLEVLDANGDYNDPHNWQGSLITGGTPTLALGLRAQGLPPCNSLETLERVLSLLYRLYPPR